MRSLGLRGIVLAALGLLALLAAGSGALVFAWTRELPHFEGLKDYRPLVSTRVLAADGSEAFVFARERRTVVPFEKIPEVMKRAVLAAEDARFYEHEGVNYLAILRCAAKGLLRGGVACGGSTITQQVVKTFLLPTDWRVKRKVKEMFLAPRLEQNLTKDEILYLYLNQIYMGHRRYGVEEASQFYFGKGIRDVTVGEAATLAGLIQSPERISPVKHLEAARARQRYVLRRMVEEGAIDARTAEAEAARPLKLRRPTEPYGAWYADAVRRQLDERYGAERVETDGLQVEVAMLPNLQRAAEAALAADLRLVDKRHGWRGAPQRLDEKQLATVLAGWRERLAAAKPQAGEVLVWDLGRVDPDEIDTEGDAKPDVRRRVRVRPLEAGETYAVLVEKVEDRLATLDMGGAKGTIPFSDVAWARKYNPAVGTAAPKRMGDVLRAGDIVLARVVPGRQPPADLARAGKPLPLSLEQVPRLEGALVAIDTATRGVRALVGGQDFARSQFNRAIQAKRQPGSAFKPFVWGAAVESGRFTPATVVYDTPDLYRDPWTGKEWKPQNFEKDVYEGPMLLRDALAHSKNTVSAKLVDALGVEAVIDFARRCGIESELPRSLSLALGTGEVTPLELVNGFATLAAGGFPAPPILVTRVRDRQGNVLEETRPLRPPPSPDAVPTAPPPEASLGAGAPEEGAAPPPVPVPTVGRLPDRVRPEAAYVTVAMMKEVVQSGTGQAAKALDRPVAAKTGTAQEHRDAWFVGMTPELAAGVWVGLRQPRPARSPRHRRGSRAAGLARVHAGGGGDAPGHRLPRSTVGGVRAHRPEDRDAGCGSLGRGSAPLPARDRAPADVAGALHRAAELLPGRPLSAPVLYRTGVARSAALPSFT